MYDNNTLLKHKNVSYKIQWMTHQHSKRGICEVQGKKNEYFIKEPLIFLIQM